MQPRSLGEWLTYLESLHPSTIELGLARVRTVAERLGLLHPTAKVVTVAGTNGKGSTCAVLEAIALQAGLATGLYSSPHLLRYNERVRINGLAVDDDPLVAAFAGIERARGDISLTYFEFGTLAALDIFHQAGLDLVILEVGLGGRLDAVNIIDPDIAVITSIALDHQDWLGDDLDSIGREKAGILRPGVPAVVVDPQPPRSVLERIEELGCSLLTLEDILLPDQSFLPLRQENVAGAVGAAGLLGLATDDVPELLQRLSVPGRVQQTSLHGRPVVLDVGHNPAAVEHLANWLQEGAERPRVALFAALSDKDIHAMMQPCRGVFDAWYLVGLAGLPRALPVDELAARVKAAGVSGARACSSVAEAWAWIEQEWPGATVVVFGSFHTVAGFMQLIEGERGSS